MPDWSKAKVSLTPTVVSSVMESQSNELDFKMKELIITYVRDWFPEHMEMNRKMTKEESEVAAQKLINLFQLSFGKAVKVLNRDGGLAKSVAEWIETMTKLEAEKKTA